jgi:uncharacterized protein YfaP (DUF2135 family)
MNRYWSGGLIMAAMAFSGCGGDKSTVSPPPGAATYGIVVGTTKGVDGGVLGGVTVTVHGHNAIASNEQGWFSISDVESSDRLAVLFSKAGYAATADIVRVREAQTTFVEAVLAPVGTSTAWSGAAGGTVSHEGGSVTVAPNTLVDANGYSFTGSATATLTTFDPTIPAHQQVFPGEFVGTTLAGETIPIVSYGFIDINVTDVSGNVLQLASGVTAAISIPIPASLQGDAPATMPLWCYDTQIDTWKETGTLTRQGNAYVGSIPHFSVWNSDVGASPSYVHGRVVDADGNPVAGARVEIRGISPRGCWNSGESSTPADGTFRIPVDAGSVCEIFASKGGEKTVPARFNSVSAGQTLEYGDIVLGSGIPKVTIALSWGPLPPDLDSHLLVPTGDHVMYSNREAGGAKLDTDDTDGYGPEIITIYALHDGVYTYAVHDYSRSATTISGSGASVSMVVEGKGIYSLTPPAGATSGVYWKVWELTVTNKRVTDVKVISAFVTDLVGPGVLVQAKMDSRK